MQRLLLVLSLLSFAPLTIMAAETIFPYKYQETTLENGLRVLMIPMKNAGLVSYFTVVNVGSRDEIEPGKSGFAHFFEHMMFRGTKKYPAEKFKDITTEIGADINAFTGDDYTGYYMHFPGRFLEKVIGLESDRFMNLEYSLPVFQTEARAVLGEYNKNFANPFVQLEERLNDTAFEKHTYKHTTMGFLKDIQDMPNQFEYSKTFFDRFYRPNNSIIVISGSFNPDEALQLIKKYYGPWKPGTYKTQTPKEPPQTNERRAKVDYQGDSLPILAVAYKAPAFTANSKDFAALSLLGELTFGDTSPLFQRIVLQEQKADFISADYTPHVDPYLFTVYARLKNATDLTSVEEAISKALEEAKTKPVDEKKLSDLKSNRKYGFLMSFDTSKSVVLGLYGSMPPYIAMATGAQAVDTLFATYASVTPSDIQKAAQKYFGKEKRTVVTLTGAKS
jgi:zinc protease